MLSISCTFPILVVYSTISFLLIILLLIKTAYQKDEFTVAKSCTELFWKHFVEEREEPPKTFQTVENDFKLKPKKYVVFYFTEVGYNFSIFLKI